MNANLITATSPVVVEKIGRGILRYGLVFMLFMGGLSKFTADEAQAIRPLLDHSPFFGWMLSAFGLAHTSQFIGVVELVAAGLIVTRRFKPGLSAIGSAMATFTFLVTLSFLITTPGIMQPDNPFGGFIMKDIILLGAAIYTGAEARSAS